MLLLANLMGKTYLTLHLEDNQITSLPSGTLDSIPSLERLWSQNNKIGSIPSCLFDHTPALRWLWLQSNGIAAIPSGLFDHTTALFELHLASNKLTAIPSRLFDHTPDLHNLFLFGNALTTLPSGLFDHTSALFLLFLQINEISELPAGLFNHTVALKQLSLRNNKLKTRPDGFFDHTPALFNLWLYSNELTSLPIRIFKLVPAVDAAAGGFVHLQYNALVCYPPLKGNTRPTTDPGVSECSISKLKTIFPLLIGKQRPSSDEAYPRMGNFFSDGSYAGSFLRKPSPPTNMGVLGFLKEHGLDVPEEAVRDMSAGDVMDFLMGLQGSLVWAQDDIEPQKLTRTQEQTLLGASGLDQQQLEVLKGELAGTIPKIHGVIDALRLPNTRAKFLRRISSGISRLQSVIVQEELGDVSGSSERGSSGRQLSTAGTASKEHVTPDTSVAALNSASTDEAQDPKEHVTPDTSVAALNSASTDEAQAPKEHVTPDTSVAALNSASADEVKLLVNFSVRAGGDPLSAWDNLKSRSDTGTCCSDFGWGTHNEHPGQEMGSMAASAVGTHSTVGLLNTNDS